MLVPARALPHRGELYLYYAACPNPAAAWAAMLARFGEYATPASPHRRQPGKPPLPYANHEWPDGTARAHGITWWDGDAAP